MARWEISRVTYKVNFLTEMSLRRQLICWLILHCSMIYNGTGQATGILALILANAVYIYQVNRKNVLMIFILYSCHVKNKSLQKVNNVSNCFNSLSYTDELDFFRFYAI